MGRTSKKLVEYLIVDTSAFIQNAPLQNVAENIVTCQEVINEITCKRQLKRLVVLPYDLIVKEVFPENIKIVTEVSKKTGDYPSLSATDIKVMALTYQLEKEKVGTEHIKTEPVMQKSVNIITKKAAIDMNHDVTGFYLPGRTKKSEDESLEEHENVQSEKSDVLEPRNERELASETLKKIDKELTEKFANLDFNINETNYVEDKNLDDVLVPIRSEDENKEESLSEENEEDGDDDDDDDDWINPSDVSKAKKQFNSELPGSLENTEDILVSVKSTEEFDEESVSEEESSEDDDTGWINPSNLATAKKQVNSELMEEKQVVVACMTTDFAMQNVLKQMNLNVSALDGRMIKQLRTFILRCYACFKTTSIMTKVFCPKCGNNTLKKVAVSLDEDGKMQIHINGRKPLTARGKKFSLPRIKGGKHPNNPILVEDQPMPHNRPTRLAVTKNNPLDVDYTAGYSPFVMRDINSKSAQLRPGTEVKYWVRKNPNESRRRRK